MAEGGGGAPVVRPPVPLDNAKMLGDLKIKLMHMKRSMMGLRQELRNRAELWEAALDEIELLEGMATEAKAALQKQKDEMKGEKNKKKKDEDRKGKDKGVSKDEKQDEVGDDKEGDDGKKEN